MINIVVFPETISNWLPEVIEKKVKHLDGLYKRLELVNLLMELPFTHKNAEFPEIQDYFINRKNTGVNGKPFTYVRNSDNPENIIFATYVDGYVIHHYASIVSVDTSRIWGIRYEGLAESIEYAQESKVLNENLNFVEWS